MALIDWVATPASCSGFVSLPLPCSSPVIPSVRSIPETRRRALLGSSDDLVVRDPAGFAIRPQMIGYLLLIVDLLMLHLGQNRNRRWFLGLPPLFAIWINCHGSFFRALRLLPAWKEVYSDNVSAIFIRSAPSFPRSPSLDSGF